MRPTINQLYQTFCNVNNCTIDVAWFNNVPFPYKAQASIPLHYRTPQNQSAFSVKTFLSFNAERIPILFI